MRNHLPVPKTDPATHKLTIDADEGAPAELRRRIKPVSLSVAELKKKYKEHSVNATIQVRVLEKISDISGGTICSVRAIDALPCRNIVTLKVFRGISPRSAMQSGRAYGLL